jgi:hypothetical protein
MKDSKGHGSDKRGAHAGGVNKVGRSVSKNVLDMIRNNPHGFSITLDGDQPKGGYMVASPGHSEIHSTDELASDRGPAIVNSYASAHADALAEPGAHIGGWTDPETGKTYLDVSHNIANRQAAIAAGRQRNQIAIYDVKHGTDIKTGGTGE